MTYSAERTFSFIKGVAFGLDWPNTMTALYVARRDHKGQMRKSGEPYITHPLTVACHLLTMGIKEDAVIAAALLHDWVEDCNGDLSTLDISYDTRLAISLVTFDKKRYAEQNIPKDKALAMHYDIIKRDRIASLVKLCDRCHNVSTMAEVFTKEKIMEYIEETETYVLPLVRSTKEQWPEHSNVLFLMKYQITAVLEAIKATMPKEDNTTEKEEYHD